MTPEMEAAQRIAAVKPNMIRWMDDDMTRALIADLAVIGMGRTVAKHLANLDVARTTLSGVRYWSNMLKAAHMVLAGSDPAPAPAQKPAPQQPATRAQRARAVASNVTVGITASECNEWLRSLLPVPLYGEE